MCITESNIIFRGYIYENNSIVTVDEIAENDGALLCYTNNVECCESSRQGEWYFPNGTTVGTSGDGSGFYRNRGPSVVRLNRRNNAMMPTGVFRCEIPDASGTNQSIYIRIDPRGEGIYPLAKHSQMCMTRTKEHTVYIFTWISPIKPDCVSNYRTVTHHCHSSTGSK